MPRKQIPINSDTLKILSQNFHPHKVPPILADLCNYWDVYPNYFCGSFEICPDQNDILKSWFRGKEAGWSKIKLFGVDAIHSLYGIWLYEGKTSVQAPIVYLGGEGEGTTLLASTWQEFISILAANQEWEPFDKEFFDATEDNEDESSVFRSWAKRKFGISPAKNPMAIMKRAKKEHPDFNAWVASVLMEK